MLVSLLEAEASRQNIGRSELVRRLVEREVSGAPRRQRRTLARRLRRLRRCVSCGAFVRRGFTCAKCRLDLPDSIRIGDRVIPSPHLPRPGLVVRPDLRDPIWNEAEALTLDTFAPVTAILYEFLSSRDSFEVTDLDDIADILAMAASFRT